MKVYCWENPGSEKSLTASSQDLDFGNVVSGCVCHWNVVNDNYVMALSGSSAIVIDVSTDNNCLLSISKTYRWLRLLCLWLKWFNVGFVSDTTPTWAWKVVVRSGPGSRDSKQGSVAIIFLLVAGVYLSSDVTESLQALEGSQAFCWDSPSYLIDSWLQFQVHGWESKPPAPTTSTPWHSSECWRGRTKSSDWQLWEGLDQLAVMWFLSSRG